MPPTELSRSLEALTTVCFVSKVCRTTNVDCYTVHNPTKGYQQLIDKQYPESQPYEAASMIRVVRKMGDFKLFLHKNLEKSITIVNIAEMVFQLGVIDIAQVFLKAAG